MAVSADYSTPVIVNGFSCKNCTDVANAKKHIDPAHPKSGPYGIDAKDDPGVRQSATPNAVTFGGNLSKLNARQGPTGAPSVTNLLNAGGDSIGTQLDVSA
jgi:hypothetical protein